MENDMQFLSQKHVSCLCTQFYIRKSLATCLSPENDSTQTNVDNGNN